MENENVATQNKVATGDYKRSLAAKKKNYIFLLIVFLLALIAGNIGIGFIINSAINEINLITKTSSQNTVSSLIGETRKSLDRLVIDYSWWDEAVENINIEFNSEWTHANFGAHFYDNEGLTHTAIIGSSNKLIYLSIDGESRDPVAYESLAVQLKHLVTNARKQASDKPQAVHDKIYILDKLFLISASVISPFNKTYSNYDRSLASILILMRPIDEDYLSHLSKNYELAAINLELGDMQYESPHIPLINSQGKTVGTLSWEIDLPGHELVKKVAPGVAVLLIILLVLLIIFLRNIRKMTTSIIEDNEELILLSMKIEAVNANLEQLSYIDGLTGIANRRKFDETLEVEWGRNQRQQTPLSLILIDIDNFKIFNDTYGHMEGDRCIQIVSMAIDNTLKRPSDLLARYGGEELVCLLPGVDREGTRKIMEDIRVSVEALSIPHTGNEAGVVTISLGGISMVPEADSQTSTWIKNADKKLYEAKNAGRNRIAI
jgi:diguanylate cyclase (GGDEF)-like protein